MIGLSIKVPASLNRFLGALRGPGRHNLFSAAAAAVCNITRRHISDISSRRHFSAARLSATPTGFLEKAARKTVFHADATKGEVVIPSPGFGRAFHDVTIVPDGKPYLTIPNHARAYGKRAVELRSLGWMIFRPPAKGAHRDKASKRYDKYQDLLMGSRDGETVCLYLLKKRVQQQQDRTLLPSDADINTTAARAMYGEILRIQRKAGL